MSKVLQGKELLTKGLNALGFSSDLSVYQEQFFSYLTLLQKWNRVVNLTSITEPEKIITHHFLDSLSIQAFLKGNTILDVGSGAGFPGIPLAIVNPQITFILLDSQTKRVRFLTQVQASLQLKNVQIVHQRIEEFRPQQTVDCVVSRAFASINNFVKSIRHLCHKELSILAMKGQYPEHELIGLPDFIEVTSIDALKVPYLDASRYLISLHCKEDLCGAV